MLALKALASDVAAKSKGARLISRLGVRGRLLSAFLGISGFAVLAAAAAMYSFLEVSNVLETIAQRKVPPALISLELSGEAERIVAIAPALLSVTTIQQHDEISKKIAAEFGRLKEFLSMLKASDLDAASIAAIETPVRRLDANLQSLDQAVTNLLSVGEHKGELVSQLDSAHVAVARALTPQIMLMDANVSQLRRDLNGPPLSAEDRAARFAEQARAIISFLPEQKALVEASAIHDTLRKAAVAESRADLPLLAFPLQRSLKALNSHVMDLDPKLQESLKIPIADFRDFIEGPHSILATREQELAIIADAHKLLNENADLSHQLTVAVSWLVTTTRQDIVRANHEARSVQRFSTTVLAVIVVLSLVSSFLIVWLYVGRSIIGRLTALSASMLAIAGGNIKARLPVDRTGDEIGRMADALRIFRDTTIENERVGRLKRFLAPQVAELVISSGDESILDSHRRDVAVLFCDLRGFTAFAETAEPEEVVQLLREYHTCLGQLVHKFAGTLERFTGDGLIVLFNDPLPCPDPCLTAARLAVEMRFNVIELVRRWRQLGSHLGFGVGIAYGYATLGRVGFEGRFDYTAIGSVVNLAARLCERARANEILIDSKVHAAIEGRMETEALGEVMPKGFSRSVEVFNITVRQDSSPDQDERPSNPAPPK